MTLINCPVVRDSKLRQYTILSITVTSIHESKHTSVKSDSNDPKEA